VFPAAQARALAAAEDSTPGFSGSSQHRWV